MPGRVSTRSSRPPTATIPHKPSSQNLGSRPSTASRPAVALENEGPPSQLRAHICRIIGEAQHTTASHRKHAVNLRKLHERCCDATTKSGRSEELEGFDEEHFISEIERCVLRLMGIKKSEAVGDRVLRFLGTFLRHSNEKDVGPNQEAETDLTSDTPSTRLASRILALLMPLLYSKDKVVRYRSTQLISHIINSVDSIDEDLFQTLSSALVKRLRDKESMIRVQAVLGLGRLAGNEAGSDVDEHDSEDGNDAGLLDRLLKALQHDPSADVRRSLLLNLPITQATLPYLLERARDQDAVTRRALFARLLPALGDFRHLSLSMREKLLRWGLRDRDENVRKAATKLFRERWIDDCAGSRAGTDGGAVGEGVPASFDALLELLERIDVVNSGVEDGVALEAMRGFWDGRPDYRDLVNFDHAFWDSLSAESAFVARTFNDFGRLRCDGRFEALVEERMPEVTRLAFYLQKYTNRLIEAVRKAAGEGNETEADDDTVELEFIVEQLLHIAQTLDYSDEMGRRKMFALMRETLAIPDLPEEATKLVVEVLRILCGTNAASEREFCSVVLEAIAEVHDTIARVGEGESDGAIQEEDSFHSARSELSSQVGTPSQASFDRKARAGKRDVNETEEDEEETAMREIMVNMKCLHIAQCMLENVEGQLQQNPLLVTMLNNLVVPAVRSHEAPLRERGLLCLGLCCLLDKTLAEENLTLFLHCFNKGHDALQVYALHILSDVLSTHGPTLLQSPALDPAANDARPSKPLSRILAKALKASDKTEVQATACTSLCKLMLSGIVTDEDLLRALVQAYFDPATAANLALRQALTYFLPVYCHSRPENQERMGRVAVPALRALAALSESIDEDDDADAGAAGDMVGLTVIAAQLVDWTDPRKLVALDALDEVREPGRRKTAAARAVNTDVHLNLARDVLDKMCSSSCSKEERKLLTSLLRNLHITSHVSCTDTVSAAHELATRAIEDRLVSDAPSRNALTKLVANLEKVMDELEREDGDVGAGTRRETRGAASAVIDSSGSSGAGGKCTAAVDGGGDVDMTDVADAGPEDDAGEGEVTVVKPESRKTGSARRAGSSAHNGGAGQESNSLLEELLQDEEEGADETGEEEEEEL